MPDYLLQLDQHIFYLINHQWSNSFFDWIMPWLRAPKSWIPLYLFIIIFSVYKFRKQGAILLVLLTITFGVSDLMSSRIIKNQVKRVRPCNDTALSSTIISRVPCGSGYSFTSSHATNHFAVGLFLAVAYRRKYPWIMLISILWAAVICYAQIYVGVHYPFDILMGSILGSTIGISFGLLFKRINPGF
jgi:membrane-associated phospholipid phosphatase